MNGVMCHRARFDFGDALIDGFAATIGKLQFKKDDHL